MFDFDIKNVLPNHLYICTDASKIDKAALAIWDPGNSYSMRLIINDKFYAYSAELIDILEALKYIQNLPRANYVIISDSKVL